MFSLVVWSQVIAAFLLVGVFASGAVGLVSRFYNPDEVYGFERIYFYITALQLFASHPVMGVGAGNYQFFDRTYAEVSAGGPNKGYEGFAIHGGQGACRRTSSGF